MNSERTRTYQSLNTSSLKSQGNFIQTVKLQSIFSLCFYVYSFIYFVLLFTLMGGMGLESHDTVTLNGLLHHSLMMIDGALME
jgi:hypothetical protein